jgi:hypothetical protein
MPEPELLARLDAHMRRGNELLARIDEHLERGIADVSPEHLKRGAAFEARIEEHIARSNEIIASEGKAFDDYRYSLRQDSLRSERILGEISNSMRRLGERFDPLDDKYDRADESRARTEEMRARMDEIIAEGRAHRAALWAILDQLRGGEGPAPATG